MAMTVLLEAPGLFLCDCPQQEVMSPVCSRPLLTGNGPERDICQLSDCLVGYKSISCLSQHMIWLTSHEVSLVVLKLLRLKYAGPINNPRTSYEDPILCVCFSELHEVKHAHRLFRDGRSHRFSSTRFCDLFFSVLKPTDQIDRHGVKMQPDSLRASFLCVRLYHCRSITSS